MCFPYFLVQYCKLAIEKIFKLKLYMAIQVENPTNSIRQVLTSSSVSQLFVGICNQNRWNLIFSGIV